MKSIIMSALLSSFLLSPAASGNIAQVIPANSSAEISSLSHTNDPALPFILAQGYLRTGVLAIGGETTGFELDILSQTQTYELILSSEMKTKIEHLNGMIIEVEGKLKFPPGTVRQPRPAIVVDELRILE